MKTSSCLTSRCKAFLFLSSSIVLRIANLWVSTILRSSRSRDDLHCHRRTRSVRRPSDHHVRLRESRERCDESRGAYALRCELERGELELWLHVAWRWPGIWGVNEKLLSFSVRGFAFPNLRDFDWNMDGVRNFNFFNHGNFDFLDNRHLLRVMVMNGVDFVGDFYFNRFAEWKERK